MKDPQKQYSSLKRSKVWNKNPNAPKPKPMRKIAIKKWLRYERDRGWVWVVFGDWLEDHEHWSISDGEVPCPKCGRSVLMKEIALDHIGNRDSFPHLAKNPHNWQPICVSCNEQKFEDDHSENLIRRNIDYRGEKLKLYMELRIASDWDEVGPDAFYPDENCGVWKKTQSGLTVITRAERQAM